MIVGDRSQTCAGCYNELVIQDGEGAKFMALIDDVDSLQSIYINRATGNGNDDDERDYPLYRQSVVDNPRIASLVPAWVRRYRNLDQFWGFIQPKFQSYAERRKFIWEEFRSLVDFAESGGEHPSDVVVSEALDRIDAEHVRIAWTKALERRSTDPEGAITMARTLLESVCKHILDEAGTGDHETTPDLNKLYKQTATLLNLTKGQHEEVVFKQILGGCTAVIEGLGALRNRLSDAHGKGKGGVKAAPRHAELAVNLAGSSALFLLATWEAKNGE
jgi:hypothetical protein